MTDQYCTAAAGAASRACHVERIQHRSGRRREAAAAEAPILARRFTFDSTTCNALLTDQYLLTAQPRAVWQLIQIV